MKHFDLVLCVVNHGKASEALRIAKGAGAKGGTIFLGTGTVVSKLLEFLELTDIRKEILFTAVDQDDTKAVLQALGKQLQLNKPGHGIAASISLRNFLGTGNLNYINDEQRVVEKPMYRAIFTVVDKGNAPDVVEAAKAAGARGGTIINARGSGIHETAKLFAMPIEPEKEIVLTIVKSEDAESVVASIRKSMCVDEHGKGVMFVVDVGDAVGLY
ncbi:P-II family nitrogen regulator [Eubacteriales bacterium OttesenSCG-928-N13]|nr:P-II family nitrogen regulator [Eubacteriales bacterium OttesenSCG-928-N13]